MAANNMYFIWGEEAFLMDRKIKEIHSLMQEESGEEVELLYLDGDELSPPRLLEELEFSPLFSLQRMVVIKRPSWLGKSRRKSSRNEEILKVLQGYLQRQTPGQTLIITAAEHNSTNALVKLLDKQATVIECKPANPQYLANWIKAEFTARGRKINTAGLSLMVKSGQDMYYLYNLIEKLSLVSEGKTISEKDIEEQVSSRDEIKVFKLTDALLDRNLKASFRAFYQLLEQGEHPVFILFMIVRQFSSLGKVKYYQENRTDMKEISRLTGMRDFAVKKLLSQTRNFSWDEIQYLFKQFLEADIRFKSTSQNDKTIMEGLLIEICGKK
ncbi:MAG: DNA polymerase III subunit delta [Syntrophomonadaceae bacterium]|nr:DNA polymerase III subunit delta [Syntrophomonadaceae bacterium]MDD3270688.1 DNA polymerase III subunit delta [Syntrophomonadaceae bacterium]MDD3897920.1 DNA polymerase III subunit delta [Syntrophomonadaceae bacterium]MDD4561772.1 DNA polymerase III subunit delta [Syntrophomonadaceae bacterium]